MPEMRILGIIPAREGSKRVPEKNFRPFAGTTLTDLAIQQAKEAQLLDKIVVNSDSETVLTIASHYEGIYAINRPKALATDESPAIDYMLYTLEELEQKGETYDFVVIIQPSSPIRSGLDIDRTIKLLMENPDADSAVSVVKVSHMLHPHKLKQMNGVVLESWLVDEKQQTAAHELPDIFVRNCAVYVFKTSHLLNGTTYGEKSLGHVMPPETSIDINEMLDFEFAEYVFLKNVR
ncbi:MAG: cytidylyltransferase domain-containing protein [Saprospiraceae bacterium]